MECVSLCPPLSPLPESSPSFILTVKCSNGTTVMNRDKQKTVMTLALNRALPSVRCPEPNQAGRSSIGRTDARTNEDRSKLN